MATSAATTASSTARTPQRGRRAAAARRAWAGHDDVDAARRRRRPVAHRELQRRRRRPRPRRRIAAGPPLRSSRSEGVVERPRPGPIVAIDDAAAARTVTSSTPALRNTKKPLMRWSRRSSTTIRAITPAADQGRGAARRDGETGRELGACRRGEPGTEPLRKPMLSNQRAVPGMRPPPKNLFEPCAMTVSPTVDSSRACRPKSQLPRGKVVDGGCSRAESPAVRPSRTRE